MKLIGNYLSPFVRRVAISLNALELPYELQALFVFKEPEQVRAHNPVVRIPRCSWTMVMWLSRAMPFSTRSTKWSALNGRSPRPRAETGVR